VSTKNKVNSFLAERHQTATKHSNFGTTVSETTASMSTIMSTTSPA